MSSGDDDLVATEGVDEASAQSTVEGADSGSPQPASRPDLVWPAGESTPAPPVDMESDASREARAERGTGQQLNTGEG